MTRWLPSQRTFSTSAARRTFRCARDSMRLPPRPFTLPSRCGARPLPTNALCAVITVASLRRATHLDGSIRRTNRVAYSSYLWRARRRCTLSFRIVTSCLSRSASCALRHKRVHELGDVSVRIGMGRCLVISAGQMLVPMIRALIAALPSKMLRASFVPMERFMSLSGVGHQRDEYRYCASQIIAVEDLKCLLRRVWLPTIRVA